MKSAFFWDITPCSPLKVNRRFGRAFYLNLHGQRMSQARNQPEAGSWRERRHFPPKRRLIFNRLDGIISQKIKLFCTAKVKETKGKAIPVTGRGGPEDCETSRLPHFLDNRLTDGSKVVRLTCRLLFTPQEDFWYSFLLEAESTPET
jgi:hypothetical protein